MDETIDHKMTFILLVIFGIFLCVFISSSGVFAYLNYNATTSTPTSTPTSTSTRAPTHPPSMRLVHNTSSSCAIPDGFTNVDTCWRNSETGEEMCYFGCKYGYNMMNKRTNGIEKENSVNRFVCKNGKIEQDDFTCVPITDATCAVPDGVKIIEGQMMGKNFQLAGDERRYEFTCHRGFQRSDAKHIDEKSNLWCKNGNLSYQTHGCTKIPMDVR